MTINRDSGEVEMQCDGFDQKTKKDCAEILEGIYDADDFYVMIEEAKSAGWRMGKDKNGEWYHLCPSCIEKGNTIYDK